MDQRTDIRISVRPVVGAQDLQSSYEVEAQKDGSGVWAGESKFDFVVADPSRLTPEKYGIALGQQLVNPAVMRALAYAGVGNSTTKEISVRFCLDPTPAVSHTIRWERLYIPDGDAPWPVAISPSVTFSRYIPVEISDSLPLNEPVFKLVIAVSNPSDIPTESAINVEKELTAFVEEFEKAQTPSRLDVTVLPGQTVISDALKTRIKDLNWKLQGGPSSLQNIGDVAAHANGLHILSHGDFRAGLSQGILYLEGLDGKFNKVTDDQLRVWITPLLRLMVFQACRTAASAAVDQPPFVGVAKKLVASGLPAAVAMQDFVLMDDARVFAVAFYRELMQDGLVDKAANAGRRAIFERGGDWSIPALFHRLANGQLWSPDPVREKVWTMRLSLPGPRGVPEALPLTVVDVANGIAHNPLEDPVGPVFNLETHARELLSKGSYICLTGPAGSSKTDQLLRLCCLLADDFLRDPTLAAPVWLSMKDLARRGPGSDQRFDATSPARSTFDQALGAAIDGNAIPDFLAKRKFVFLLAGEQSLGPAATRAALRNLRALLARLSSACLFIFDETNLGALQLDFPKAAVLVVRPLELSDVRVFLSSTQSPSDNTLKQIIDSCGLGDLAAIPWLLNQMRDLVSFGHEIRSRGDVMSLVADNLLSLFGGRGIPRSCAIQALSCIAWSMQNNRTRSISNAEMWRILDAARGGQDFTLSAFRDALADSNLLVPAGEDASALSYRFVSGYFAARYLADSPQSQILLEDITASLGRLSRLKHWESSLIMFAGLQRSAEARDRFLQVLLAGSSLFEGEQVFLAARLFVEMRQADSSSEDVKVRPLKRSDVVLQIIDTLVWRSRADLPRPYEDRRRAVESLASMRHKDAVPHLISLACDPVRVPFDVLGSHNGVAPLAKRYDFSGIRMLAIGGLFDQPDATGDYVKAHRAGLLPIFQAWQDLIVGGKREPMVAVLKQNDPSLSTVAAFAFAFEGDKFEPGHPLLVAFADPATNEDLLWGIGEVFVRMDSGWLRDQVILPAIARQSKPDPRICYLIQKSTCAPEGSAQRKYLEDCMHDQQVSAAAIRALAALPDTSLQSRLRQLCHLLLEKKWKDAQDSEGIPVPADADDEYAWRLQYQAIMALRDVGDESSIELLRQTRTHLNNIFVQLSFQVGEEIYWRFHGGLSNDTF